MSLALYRATVSTPSTLSYWRPTCIEGKMGFPTDLYKYINITDFKMKVFKIEVTWAELESMGLVRSSLRE